MLETNAAAVWWTERGSGQPVVLVPGGPGMASDYLDPLVGMLEAEAQVIQFDPRGCGRSESRPPYDLATMLSDLDLVRGQVGVERWVLVGHSAGALQALAYGIEYPTRVSGVVCIAGGPGLHDDRQIWQDADEAGRDAGLDTAPDTRFPFNQDLNRTLLESWRRYIKHPRLPRRMADFPVPLLVVHGEEDIWPSWPMEQIAELVPDGKFVVVKGARHIPWTSHAEDIRALLLEFLRGLDGAGPIIGGMDDGSWKIDHNERGELVATHDHGGGVIVNAELQKPDDGVEFWLCECGAQFDRGRGRGERATV